MPGLRDPRDYIVDTKKRYDCFVATDLDFLLRHHGINTLLITGINTSSCVLATAIRANALDYAPVIVEDCVDTMDGPALHDAALACLRAAFGWVMRSDAVLNAIGLPAARLSA
jgi:biuret amidohydrolase